MSDKKYVTYEEFGAVGDGVTDDFVAIKNAHDYANEHGLPVKADDTKTYYIHETRIDGAVHSATVKTDVEWGKAHFIIDDTDVAPYDGTNRHSRHIFDIVSDYAEYTIDDPAVLAPLAGIGEGTTKLSLALGYPALICIYNKESRIYRRHGGYGKNSEVGVDQHEILLIDGEGNVDPSTPFMFNYDTVSKIVVARCDIKPITVSGGIFTTRASRMPSWDPVEKKIIGWYVSRGLKINRSFTTVVGVEHYIEGEITTFEHRDKDLRGLSYVGFFSPTFANEVTLKNCVLTGRRYYYIAGTYDFSADLVNKIYLIDCTQSNFEIQDEEGKTVYSIAYSPVSGCRYHWGIGGTNFCKNMEYIGCKLSRFDAHQGLYNGKIINCDINFMELIGKGELLIENTRWYSPCVGNNSFLFLRCDYGSTWEGTLKVKDSVLYVQPGDLYLSLHVYINWDFGYTCYFPNIDIENLKIEGLTEGSKVYFLTEHSSAGKEPNIHLPETVNTPHEYDDGTTDMNNFNITVPPEYVKIDIDGDVKVHMTKMPFFDKTDFSKSKPGQIVIDE